MLRDDLLVLTKSQDHKTANLHEQGVVTDMLASAQTPARSGFTMNEWKSRVSSI